MDALVIDDSRAVRRVMSGALREVGFAVHEAGDGQDALDFLYRHERLPDVALVDLNMPRVGGLEFVAAVRSDARLQELRMIVVSTETELELVAAALAAGADEYVMKPFTKEVLVNKLQLSGIL